MKPIVKYRGGKSREIPKFIRYFPETFETYYEPFFGGGAVFFYLEPRQAVINDVNERLMNFYLDVRDRYPELRAQLDQIENQYSANQADYKRRKSLTPELRVPNANENLYYALRDEYNHPNGQHLDSVLYYFINKTAFSGMIRFNADGEFNVPFGRYANFNSHLLKEEHSRLLQNAEILVEDYQTVFDMAGPNDFMFLDPPYDCVFNDYGNLEQTDGFTEADQRRLAAAFRLLRCRAVMVIGATPLTRELYEGLIVGEYFHEYSVNIKNRFNYDRPHLIVRNF